MCLDESLTQDLVVEESFVTISTDSEKRTEMEMNKVTTDKTLASARKVGADGSRFVSRGTSDADFSQTGSSGHLSSGSLLMLRCTESSSTCASNWVCIPLWSLITVKFSCACCKNSSPFTAHRVVVGIPGAKVYKVPHIVSIGKMRAIT